MPATTSDRASPPVTLDRVTQAVEAVGLIPFVSSTGQVAAILPNRTVRIAVPEGHPVQGVAPALVPRSTAIRRRGRARK